MEKQKGDGTSMAPQQTDSWRERALAAEARNTLLREVLLDVDAILNIPSREPVAIVARVRRDERSICQRVQDALLDTAETHCRNWAYGCGPDPECSCGCSRCPGSFLARRASVKKSG